MGRLRLAATLLVGCHVMGGFAFPLAVCRSARPSNTGRVVLDCPSLNTEQRSELVRLSDRILAEESDAHTLQDSLDELVTRVNAGLPLTASRRLTVDQKKALLYAARSFPSQRISVAYIHGDVEGETLAGDVLEVLKRAGWDATGVSPMVQREPTGVLVAANPGEVRATAAGQMLLEMFQSFGLDAKGGNTMGEDLAVVRLLVGRKPVSATPLTIPVITPHTATFQADPFVCPRPAPGDPVNRPAELRSAKGVLKLDLALHSGIDVQGLRVFCYLTAAGDQAPTLRVRPGDELILTLKNALPQSFGQAHAHTAGPGPPCGGAQMDPSSTNLHFHGWSIPPTCHQDETLRTVIQPSDPPFQYRIRIPKEQAPGLYWYHPHPHGFTEAQVLGGASGALIVEGIEQRRPEVAGLPERVLVLRDQRVAGFEEQEEDAGPGKDVSLNFVPVQLPLYRAAELPVFPASREFWRIVNASADTYFDLQVQAAGVAQLMQVVALDGVPVGDRDFTAKREHVLLPPGGRAELIVTTPPAGATAQLVTLAYDTGPDGVVNPAKVLATIRARQGAPAQAGIRAAAPPPVKPFVGLANLTPAGRRQLYFSEDLADPARPRFFITLEGATPKVFQMDFKEPDVVVRQGTVEDWVIENRAREAHAFHIHQLHFQLLERDGRKVDEAALRDTIDLPYWDGKSERYPSVRIRMDFRSREIVGTFVFHCHILEHEDGGMMGSIQVLPAKR